MSSLILSCLKCLKPFLVNLLSIGFLCENQTLQFGKPEDPIFLENSSIYSFGLNLLHYHSYLVSNVS
jgi:hypothetical protein